MRTQFNALYCAVCKTKCGERLENLAFRNISTCSRGLFCDLLNRSYAGLCAKTEKFSEYYYSSWQLFDESIFTYPHIFDKCVFVSVHHESIIGFASWDPREFPVARVGHNCILPEFRNHGFGRAQVCEMLRRLRCDRFSHANVVTGNCSAFLPARKMYSACGFKLTRNFLDTENFCEKLCEFELSF